MTVTVRAARKATVTLGEPIVLEAGRGKKMRADELTQVLGTAGPAIPAEIR